MDPKKYDFKVGEIASLPQKTRQVSKSGMKSYEFQINSRYICIRECVGNERGILVKVLGKTSRDNIIVTGSEPFFKEEKYEGFAGDIYYGYRFPSIKELKDVLDIIRNDKTLIEKFEKASMHINPNSTFWVRDTTTRLLLLKDPQFYDAGSDQFFAAGNDKNLHYRISVVYFGESQLIW